MKLLRTRNARIALLAAACLSSLVVATISRAQVPGNSDTPGQVQDLNRRSALQQIAMNQAAEDTAYEAFTNVKAEDPDKKIKLGEDFLGKYPKSKYAENVDVGLTNAYYAKQEWPNFYASADRALALKPDDVDVLVTVGWVIPHIYDPNNPDAEKLLDKAEAYEKQAIPVIPAMSKPAGMNDAQFSGFKAQKSNEAHSALGLIYFRRHDYGNSVTELQQATQNTASPDQTDLFVLATSLDQLNRHAEAAESFERCGQIDGPLQQPCKQGAVRAKQQAAQPK
jgi:tetratricopeptide (TPR) repeat protein